MGGLAFLIALSWHSLFVEARGSDESEQSSSSVRKMTARSAKRRLRRIARVVSYPSWSGIIASISTTSTSGCSASIRMPDAPLSAYSTVIPCSSRALVRAKTLRTSSSMISTVDPSSRRAAALAGRSGTAEGRRIAGVVRRTAGIAMGIGMDNPSGRPAEAANVSTSRASGRYRVKLDPAPGSEDTVIQPPISRASDRLIDRPSPVPPYLRLVVPSACWNASKMRVSLSSEIPIPVSATVNPITCRLPASPGRSNSRSAASGWPLYQATKSVAA